MSYLTSYATRNPPVRGRGVDERLALNLPGFDGGAYVRVFVEDTTFRKWRRACRRSRASASASRTARTRSRSGSSSTRPGRAQNSLHKIDTLLGAMQRFRDALDAEAELYAHREQHRRSDGRGPKRIGYLSARGAREVRASAGSSRSPFRPSSHDRGSSSKSNGPTRSGSRSRARGARRSQVRRRPRASARGSSSAPHPRPWLLRPSTTSLERRCPMSYLTRQRKTPQSAPLAGQVANSARRLRLGGRRLGAAAPLPDPRLARAAATTPASGSSPARTPRPSSAASRPTARARSRRSSRSARRPRAEERPGALRARDGGRRRRRGDPQAPRSRRCRACAARRRTCSSSSTFVEGFRGWGRGLRRAVGGWYAGRSVDALAYQAVKYRQRDGVTHRDVLRLAHPAGRVSAGNPTLELVDGAPPPVRVDRPRRRDRRPAAARRGLRARADGGDAGARRRSSSASTACRARRSRASTSTSPEVWEALLEDMPMTALIRNLATMTRVGVLAPGSAGTAKAVAQLGDRERIRKARVHPIALLAALRTYAAGRGVRGRHTLDAGRRRSSTRSTPRSTRRSRTSSRPASGCCSRSTCRARWRGGDGRRRAGPDPARRLGGAGARDGGDRDAVRDGRLLRRQRRLPQARSRQLWHGPARTA